MKTAVLFIIFKRYDTALQVFNQIRKAKPPRLYVAADAPRPNVNGETEECEKTREIVNLVDWPCQVKTLFQKENQGCGKGPYKAITWFFENEERGIVLEDDCVAHLDFFNYCEVLLDRYDNNTKISLITGRNALGEFSINNQSYLLSALHFCWGWASWRRVWRNYDYDIKEVTFFPYFKHLISIFGCSPFMIMWRLEIFMIRKMHPEMDVWDYQFAISTQMHESYTLVPCVNMVTNVGFDERATHTSGEITKDFEAKGMPSIIHPQKINYNKKFDKEYSKRRFSKFRLMFTFSRTLYRYIKF